MIEKILKKKRESTESSEGKIDEQIGRLNKNSSELHNVLQKKSRSRLDDIESSEDVKNLAAQMQKVVLGVSVLLAGGVGSTFVFPEQWARIDDLLKQNPAIIFGTASVSLLMMALVAFKEELNNIAKFLKRGKR